MWQCSPSCRLPLTHGACDIPASFLGFPSLRDMTQRQQSALCTAFLWPTSLGAHLVGPSALSVMPLSPLIFSARPSHPHPKC